MVKAAARPKRTPVRLTAVVAPSMTRTRGRARDGEAVRKDGRIALLQRSRFTRSAAPEAWPRRSRLGRASFMRRARLETAHGSLSWRRKVADEDDEVPHWDAQCHKGKSVTRGAGRLWRWGFPSMSPRTSAAARDHRRNGGDGAAPGAPPSPRIRLLQGQLGLVPCIRAPDWWEVLLTAMAWPRL